jgi:hypothetical protein
MPEGRGFTPTSLRASGTGRITRKTAAEALQAFMARVNAVNETPRFLYTVNAVVVFGSYLKNVGELGDLDLAVQLKSRIADAEQRVTKELEHACSSGRSFSRFIDQLTWAHDEVMLALKARKRTISVQPWSSFIGMEKETSFKYKVLLGDAESIRAELKGMDMEQSKPGKDRRRYVGEGLKGPISATRRRVESRRTDYRFATAMFHCGDREQEREGNWRTSPARRIASGWATNRELLRS